MAQLDPSRYKRLTKSVEYGVSDGLYWDGTNSELVIVIDDTVKLKVPLSQTSGHVLKSDGTDIEPGTVNALIASLISGDITVDSSGVATIGATKVTGDMLAGSVTRAKLLQEALVAYPVPITEMRVWDAMQTVLPGTAANDDMGIITGTPGTDAPTLQGVDFGGASTDEKCAFLFRLPPEYDDGETITARLRAAMLTTVSDGTATVDVECFKCDRDGAVGADICATAAQSINSLTPANKDFTITPTGLASGDLLVFVLTFAGSDVGDLGVMVPEISQVELLLDVKG